MDVLQGKIFALRAVLRSAGKLCDVSEELIDNVSTYWQVFCDH